MKGKDMVLCDFLSQQNNDDSNPSEKIPISFNTYKILEDSRDFGKCNNKIGNEKYLIQKWSPVKTSGTKNSWKFRGRKELDPNLRPEKQHVISKQGKLDRTWVGHGRAGLRRRKPDPINQAANQPLDVTHGIPRGAKIETGKRNSAQGKNNVHDRSINNNSPFAPDIPLHQVPLLKPSTQQNTNKISYNPNINLDFGENSPFQEGIISETFQRSDKSFFQNSKELGEVINKENLIHKFLPRQTDIDKILKIIQRKVFRGTHLTVEVKEIQVGYLQSPYFKDLYQYLSQNKLLSSKSAIKN